MEEKKKYKLDLKSVLNAIDNQDLTFYDRLSDEDKKGYSPYVLMRYMSSLTDQNRNAAIALLATNDFVNVGFKELYKYPDLQHKLLCLAGMGGKQYRPWIPSKTSRSSNIIDKWLNELYPDLNEEEIEIVKSQFTLETWSEFVKYAGLSDAETKELIQIWKKKEK